jgi:ABC-2 type transport system permease protein
MVEAYVSQLEAHLRGPLFYGLILVVSLILGLYFFSALLSLANAAPSNHQTVLVAGLFLNLSLLMIVICPLISMGLLSGPHAQCGPAAAQSCCGSPALIVGRYLAALSVAAILAGIGVWLCAVAEIVIDLDWGQVLSCYLGLVLLSASFLALGLLAGAMTRSRFMAFLAALILILALLAVGRLAASVKAPGLSLVMGEAGLGTHLPAFLNGELRLKDLAYYLFVSVFALALSRTLGERA